MHNVLPSVSRILMNLEITLHATCPQWTYPKICPFHCPNSYVGQWYYDLLLLSLPLQSCYAHELEVRREEDTETETEASRGARITSASTGELYGHNLRVRTRSLPHNNNHGGYGPWWPNTTPINRLAGVTPSGPRDSLTQCPPLDGLHAMFRSKLVQSQTPRVRL